MGNLSGTMGNKSGTKGTTSSTKGTSGGSFGTTNGTVISIMSTTRAKIHLTPNLVYSRTSL